MIKLKPRTRIILLSVISILIVVTIVLGVTYSFMQANIDSSSVTEVSLSSCAKITLSDTGASINLNNTNPISKNRALQTTPYTFTVTSSCESYVGFNLYLATLNTNTLVDSSIHYIITRNGSKDILAEGILSEATNALSEFTADDQNQLNIGINGTFGTIYKLYNDSIPLQGEASYDLYLYIDSDVTDASTMGKTFNAGIAIKSYDREADSTTLADYIMNEVYTGVDGENGLYYHDGQGDYENADQEAGDNSYRYAGANPNNYVCFGSDAVTCPEDNLYRIIGVFDGQVKLIKNTYYGNITVWDDDSNDSSVISTSNKHNSNINKLTYARYDIIAAPIPGDTANSNWTKSVIRTLLNVNYYNSISDYSRLINLNAVWYLGGINGYVGISTAKNSFTLERGDEVYQNNPLTDTAAIGLMYPSDYGYAASPSNWSTNLHDYDNNTNRDNNWMFIGINEWTITVDSYYSVYGYALFDNGYLRAEHSLSCQLVSCAGGSGNYYRPTFYLNSEVQYISGTGTESDPYRIN